MQAKQQRFYRLLEKLSVNLTAMAPAIWQNLVAAYQEPQRQYHTLQHISECLQLFDHYQYLATQPLAVEFSLWFHDAVYQPQQLDNEKQSADWAISILQQAQIPANLTQQIYALIMASSHAQQPQSHDEKLLVDLDLAIFAATPVRFAEYQQQIRAEYFWVPEAVYQQKRREVLIKLFNHGDIYHHPEIKAALELSARANLQHALTI